MFTKERIHFWLILRFPSILTEALCGVGFMCYNEHLTIDVPDVTQTARLLCVVTMLHQDVNYNSLFTDFVVLYRTMIQ